MKTIFGEWVWHIPSKVWTIRGFPTPLQFQDSRFKAPGGATHGWPLPPSQRCGLMDRNVFVVSHYSHGLVSSSQVRQLLG